LSKLAYAITVSENIAGDGIALGFAEKIGKEVNWHSLLWQTL